MHSGDVIDDLARLFLVVGNAQQLANLVERKSEITGSADERQPLKVLHAVGAVTGRRERRRREQADLLIIADRLHLRVGRSAELTHSHERFLTLYLLQGAYKQPTPIIQLNLSGRAL